MNENKYVTHQQTTTTELQAPDLGQAHTFKNVSGIPTFPTLDSGVTVQRRTNYKSKLKKALLIGWISKEILHKVKNYHKRC